MRTIINLITIVFVAGSIFFLVKSNNINIPDLAQKYFGESVSPSKNLGTGDTLATKPVSFIPSISTPGPLKKFIETRIGSSETAEGALTRSGIISHTNAERQTHSVKLLKESYMLDASATVKATDILKRQYFEHVAPDGRTVSDLVTDQGYVFIKIGENLALGNFKNDAEVVAAWMASAGHRANILDSAFSEIGVGVAFGTYQGREVYVAVQHFGRPRSECPSVSDTLRAQVVAGQKALDTLSAFLEQLKTAIDEGRAQEKDMSATIEIYNQNVEKYQTLYLQIDALRRTYNAEVASFNTCISAVK